MYNEAYGGSVMPVTFDDFLDELENLKGGDQQYQFPMNSMHSQFKYINRNVQETTRISLYICTPRKDLPSICNPMVDFFNPWVDNVKDSPINVTKYAFLDPDYRYDPAVTAQQGVLGDLTANTEMYPSTTYQVKKLTHSLNPATATSSDAELQETTVAGFGRANVHAPYSWYDHVNALNKYVDQKTSQMSCFNSPSIVESLRFRL